MELQLLLLLHIEEVFLDPLSIDPLAASEGVNGERISSYVLSYPITL